MEIRINYQINALMMLGCTVILKTGIDYDIGWDILNRSLL
jgi:hypothetical protein